MARCPIFAVQWQTVTYCGVSSSRGTPALPAIRHRGLHRRCLLLGMHLRLIPIGDQLRFRTGMLDSVALDRGI